MTEVEMRQVLTAIQQLGMIGRNNPDEPATRAEAPLIVALGTVAGLTSVALDGETIPPQRLELGEAVLARLMEGHPVVLTTNLGFRVELLVRTPA
jgi:hypothetical protein